MTPDSTAPPAANRPLRWIIPIYAILALAAFAFPAGLRGWLEDRDTDGRLWLPIAIARQIEAASDAVGVKPVGAHLRAWFGKLIGDDES
ncbi:hypothetical protein [Methylocapsa sp. S129]|uniref:hypothetical protein n=1 Tax=Methylocapsa sp. S129 TaxID=1641869 RepID=UPI00131B2A51|nr:hypothetical protein [Methylocapsa sp. S129]